ncbi:MAG: YicC family protein [Clostridia bacterium]|nr:YicC family protein [Clostridia bacterium]
MAVSMTGYGKGVLENESISIKVEIKSVNSRYLDINFKSTRSLSFMEEKIRGLLKDTASRGKIDIYAGLRGNGGEAKAISVDRELARSYKNAVDELKGELRLKGRVSVNELASIPGIITVDDSEPDEETIAPYVMTAVGNAMDSWMQMKQNEGTAIEKDMMGKIEEMEAIMNGIEKTSVGLAAEYKNKLAARIRELLEGNSPDESRIAQEAAFLADKSSVDEEIIRLRSHMRQFRENISKKETGRKLDFIIQEMNRESNTIGSKSSSLALTNHVLELKCIIEKLREQAQNIE